MAKQYPLEFKQQVVLAIRNGLTIMQGTLQCSEDRIARLLFKLTVEISMMMNVLAAGLEIDVSQLDALRWRCVQEVKKTNGTITFKDTLTKNQSAE